MLEEEERCENWQPDESITKELFLAWREPRAGRENPERMTNPVWEWLVETRICAYLASRHFLGEDFHPESPGWCCDRYGQSSTPLPDGRVVLVAGEHEDYYDPDFFIYNDVIVRNSDGSMEMYGYPHEVFPPTDFHTATLWDEEILLIGNLSYGDRRRSGMTQVMRLDTKTWQIRAQETSGRGPGWLHSHEAILAEDGMSIVVCGGKVDPVREGGELKENFDDWKLDLATWCWTRLTEKNWTQWAVRRVDGKQNALFWIRSEKWKKEMGFPSREMGHLGTVIKEAWERGAAELIEGLYQPPLAYEAQEEREGEYRVHRITVDGVTVRYVEGNRMIAMTVEGNLPESVVAELVENVRAKAAFIEGAVYEAVRM